MPLLVGENFIDRAAGNAGELRIAGLVVRKSDQAEGQRPPATARPRRVVER
jgi:hypothetical protein